MREQMTSLGENAAGSLATGNLKAKQLMPAGNSRTDTLRRLLSRPNQATAAQIQKRLIWQRPTVRAAISRQRTPGVTTELDRSGKFARYRAMSAEVDK